MRNQGITPIRGIIVLALVAVAAIASWVMPAGAAGGSLSRRSYRSTEGIFATFKDAAQSTPGVGPMSIDALPVSDLGTMATLRLPAGRFAIFGKAWAEQHGGTIQHIECALVAGVDVDHTRTQTGEFDASLSLEVVHTFAEPGSATIECADDGAAGSEDAHVKWLKIIAIRAPSLSNGASL
ncbi:MAG TPA: hypothetical protein VGB51_10960 [Actinomycetota bacterium]